MLLFEEPETHLHPHLRRRMRSVLGKLAASGWYVITCTHAPELVDLESEQRIAKVCRRGDKVTCMCVDTGSLTEGIRLQGKIDEHGNGEVFFANKVIVCEGKDDEFGLKTALAEANVDLDGRSVSILGVGGKGNVVDYVGLLKQLGTPWCAVVDEDRQPDGSYKNKADEVVAAVRKLQSTSDELLQWEVDLEHCLGIGRNRDKPHRAERKADPEWQAAQIGKLSGEDVKARYPLFAAVVEAGKAWAER